MSLQSSGGKGSAKRPADVSMDVFDSNFERIFGKKEIKIKEDDALSSKIDKMCQRLLDSEEHAVESAIPQVAEDAVILFKELQLYVDNVS